MSSIIPINLLPKCISIQSSLITSSNFLNTGGGLLSLVRRINYKVPTTETTPATSSTNPVPSVHPEIPSVQNLLPPVNLDETKASQLINSMSLEDRTLLLTELRKVAIAGCDPNKRPSRRDLFQLGYHHSLPFIGFGFLDNFVMILAGEYIDVTLGAKLGISTMAAAALGNTISDMMGVGSAWYVETLAVRLGAESPLLSKSQLDMIVCRIATNLGRCLGVMLGCLLGMIPLLFINTSDDASKKENISDKESTEQNTVKE